MTDDVVTDPHPPSQGPAPRTVFDGTVDVAYGQVYLIDGEGDLPEWDVLDASSAGIVGVQPAAALLVTGRHTGSVGFTVVFADADPGALLGSYEDVVEIDFEAPDGQAAIVQWAGEGSHELPPLPAGAGRYRLRYHARGMDEAETTDVTSGPPVDAYLVQIWPSRVPQEPRTVKQTSSRCAYWQREAFG